MSVDEYGLLLNDRIEKIKAMDEYGLLLNGYVSFSGGKDSTVVHYLMDMALPGNKIPRVYLNTGIEYKAVSDYVKRLAEKDKRIVIVRPSKNITETLEKVGYPFKSKEHSLYLSVFQNSGETKTVKRYLGRSDRRFSCPKVLRYQFMEAGLPFKVSNKCCDELKKKPAEKWAKENRKTIAITGMRGAELGLRQSMKGCAVFADKDCKALKKFHPLFPVEDWWVDEFVKRNNIELCELYKPPFNFQRTGCKGCPFAVDLQAQLDKMAAFLPAERKQCEKIWGKVYAEYRRINYRLEKTLFD